MLIREESHEKHTEVYSLGLCFDQPEIDYGLIVDRNAVACVTINGGIVTTNTTAATGCTKVAVGTVLQIAPGVTYEVPPQLSVPTDRQNYGDILKDLTGARIDYGHILEGTGINCPFGSLGTIGNNAEHRFLRNTVGTNALGGLITITGASEIFFTPPYIVEGGFVIQGAAKTTFSLLHPSEGGTIAAFSGAAETVRWSPDEEQLLFTTKGAATTLFSLLHPGSGLIRVTPGVDQARAARPPAGGFIDISGGAVEAFIANPPEEQVLFRFTGVIGESFTPASHIGEGVLFNFNGSSELLTFAEQPEVNIRISGAAVTVRVPNHIGSGSLLHYLEQQNPLLQIQKRDNYYSHSLELLQSPLLQHQKLDLDLQNFLAQLHQKFLHLQSNHSEQSVLGDAKDRFTPQHIGSGSLFALNGAAEAVGFNPPEEAPLFKFTGELTEAFIANPPEEGTEIKLSGDTTPQILTFAEQPFGTISVFGDAETPRSRPFIGSGSLRKLSGSAESITFNPEEKQMLFSFTGGITSEKHTESYVGVDTPIRLRRGSLSDFQTYDFQPNWNGSGTVRVFGEADTVYSPVYFGSGTFKKFSGAAESLTVNPDEKQMLFSFTGESAERTTASHVGEGNLFAFSGGAERVAYAPTLLADLRINGEVGIRYVPNNVGFGNIFNIGGSAESITFNPDERQLLFSFTGEVVESFGVAETKQIEVDIAGDGSFIRSHAYEGSGTVSVFGESNNKLLINNVGFGNIFNIGGSAEAVTFNPDEKQMLFSFTGERLAEKRTSREISQGGVITITGTAGDPSHICRGTNCSYKDQRQGILHYSPHYCWYWFTLCILWWCRSSWCSSTNRASTIQGCWRFREQKISSICWIWFSQKTIWCCRVCLVQPRRETDALLLYWRKNFREENFQRNQSGGTLKVSGESDVLLTLAHQGEGTIPVTGDTKFTRARDFVGFGTLRKLSGAAESLTFNPTERDMLFSFTGESIAERTTFRELGTAGKFTFTGTSGDPLLTFAEQPFVNIDVTGDSVDIRSRAYQSTGTLFAINNVDEAFVRTGYQGSGSLKLSELHLYKYNYSSSSRVYVWII